MAPIIYLEWYVPSKLSGQPFYDLPVGGYLLYYVYYAVGSFFCGIFLHQFYPNIFEVVEKLFFLCTIK